MLKGVSAVLGVLSLVPGLQFLAPFAVAAGAIALAIDVAVKLATGKGSWTSIGIDAALTFLPGGKILDGIKGVKAAVAGERGLAAGERALGAGEKLLAEGKALDDVATDAREAAVAMEKRICEADPVDLVSGEMVLSTDRRAAARPTAAAAAPHPPVVLPGRPLVRPVLGVHTGPAAGGRRRTACASPPRTACCLKLYPPAAEGTSVLPVRRVRGWPWLRRRRRVHGDPTPSGVTPPPLRTGPCRPAQPVRTDLRRAGHHHAARWPRSPTGTGTASTWSGTRRARRPRSVHSGGYRVAVETERGRITALRLRGAGGEPGPSSWSGTATTKGATWEIIDSCGVPLRFTYDAEGRIVPLGRPQRPVVPVHVRRGTVVRTEGADGF